jgi:anti-anti-sigma factor
MMDCARTSSAHLADRGPDEVRAQDVRDREADRLVEDWITSRIDRVSHRSSAVSGPGPMSIESSIRRVHPRATHDATRSAQSQGWKRLRLDHRGDVTVVQVLDHQLIHETPLAELRGELRDLTAAGCSRIVLNLARVEQVSSQFLEILTTLDRLCSSRPGGCLKLCKIGPEVRRIIELCGLERHFEVAADLPSALEGAWPKAGGLVPIELLDSLDGRSGRGSAPRPEVDSRSSPIEAAQGPGPQVFLTIRREGSVLGTLRIPENGLRIGRDTPCELRLRHQSVSRVHAWVGRRDGRFCLEDLGSSNGTTIGGERLRSSSRGLKHVDSFSIGPYQLELSGVEAHDRNAQTSSDPFSRRIERETPEGPDPGGDAEMPDASSSDLGASPTACVRLERIDDVLILSPVVSQLDREETIEALRESLDWLVRRPEAAVNVVINLAPVACLSGRAIGLIMAHHLKLRRHGGSLRLAQPAPAVMVALEVVGLQSLIETFPSLDDAVLNPWPA